MPELVPHGTLDYAELAEWGYEPDELLIFSSNINPYGPPPSVIEAVSNSINASIIALYPDRLSSTLRLQLAEHHQVPAKGILVGNGTADIMWLLALQYLRAARVAILGPTFGEYANAANVVGTDATLLARPGWKNEEHRFTPSNTSLIDCIHEVEQLQPDVVFVCNPNSPTGEQLTPQEMQDLINSAPQALWIIDEAYAAFAPDPWSAAEWTQSQNLIVLRSMTKDFALGGLRLGYAIAQPDEIRHLSILQPPWNVNSLAQIAGSACMTELTWRDKSLSQLRTDTNELLDDLSHLGFDFRNTTTNYFLVTIENPAAFREQLLHHRIVVRDCTSFGLPDYVRIATQRPEHNQQLLDTLQALQTSQ